MVRKSIYILCMLSALSLASCVDLDLNPPSSASSENWYSDADEITISINDFYREYLYALESDWWTDRRTDDWAQREEIYEFVVGNVTSEWSASENFWINSYKGISRVNRVVEAIDALEQAGTVAETTLTQLRAEALFFRAFFYSRLINTFGAVPFYTAGIDLDEARLMGRTDVATILEQIYSDFDYAIQNLPVDNSSSGFTRVGRGAAMALKARIALYQEDWEVARDAAKACMDLGVYSLYPDYGELFLSKQYECETIFMIPRSIELGHSSAVKNFMPRTSGGNAVAQPSWELLAAYTCTDGLPIDESPLFNPRKPFENRDPRCTYTIVEHGTELNGYVFNPHPDATTVMNYNTGKEVTNKDARSSKNPYCAYNCMQLRKGVQPEWTEQLKTENPIIIVRYADVLLMYAESKIELDEIDQSVLDAINDVRARAYKVTREQTDSYPAVTTTDQTQLRRALRLERRMEFAWEGRRFWDLKRWRWFEKAFACDYYGCLTATELKNKIIDQDLWFWPETPPVDEDGFPDFTPMGDKGLIQKYVDRNFDPKTYLWPIPNEDVMISNGVLEQNDGY